MALKRSQASAGTLNVIEHVSQLLRDNPWGAPSAEAGSLVAPGKRSRRTSRQATCQPAIPCYGDCLLYIDRGWLDQFHIHYGRACYHGA